MLSIWTIAHREYRQHFISPVAYVVSVLFLLILGIIFVNQLDIYLRFYNPTYQPAAPDIDIFIGPLISILLFVTPAISMRSLSEEQKTGTIELLLTAPIREWELILGKWLGSLLFALTLLGSTLVYPLILNHLLEPGIDWGTLAAAYIGVILLVGAMLALGVTMSAFFSNQIATYFATLGILLFFWLFGIFLQSTSSSPAISEVLRRLGFAPHLVTSFLRGFIALEDVVYFLSVTFLALFIGKTSLEVRRWSG